MIEIIERPRVELVRRYPDGPPGGWRQGLRGSVGGGADNRLLKFSDGTPTRGSEGSYQTGEGSIAWAGENELRYEDRGDGNGPVALFEGPSTNLVVAPENINNTDWFLPAQSVAGDVTAPDGEPDAKIIEIATGADRSAEQFFPAGIANNGVYTGSVWARDVSGDFPEWLVRMQGKDGGVTSATPAAIVSAWRRGALTINVGTNAAEGTSLEARSQGNTTSGAQWAIWGAQMEELPFASSYIRGGTRAADVLTFTPAQIPAAMLSGRWEFDFYPLFNSTDGPPSEGRMFHFNSATYPFDGITFANRRFGIRVGSVTPTPPVVSFSAGQKITLSMDMAAGTMTVAGCTTGNGTRDFSAFIGTSGFPTPTDLYVGSRNGIAPSWGRISEPRVW